MLTILAQSVSDRRLKNFRTLKWKSSNNLANSLTETFWITRTSFRQFTFIEYLKIKRLMMQTTEIEERLLYDAPGALRDNLFIDALRAWMTETPRDILWQRLQLLQRLLGRPSWSKNLYYTYDNCITYEISENRRSIRKGKKYSGYVRNSSAVGSKRATGSPKPEPERFEWSLTEEIDYYHFLTVGEFNSGLPGVVLVTLNEFPKGRNGKTSKNQK